MFSSLLSVKAVLSGFIHASTEVSREEASKEGGLLELEVYE
jgi:hypothetical protein